MDRLNKTRCGLITAAARCRAPFQVLVFPYRFTGNENIEYAVFRRSDLGVWQGIAGGGEISETPEATSQREAHEEAGIAIDSPFLRLNAIGQIGVEHFTDRTGWSPDLLTIPEYSFGVAVVNE